MERSLSSSLPTLNPTHRHWLHRLLAALQQWRHNARSRRQLAKLDAYLLSDAGITESDRLAEISKPFWR
nr:DUF1127 domain-containing protein [uncultured Pseudomonas sp.]